MPYSLVIDVVVAVLLIITIGYAMKLNKRLGLLRRDRGELEKLASTFVISSERANESLGQLHKTAEVLQRQIESAHALHDDLAFLIERAESSADRLEETIRSSRGVPGSALEVEHPIDDPVVGSPANKPRGFYETKDEARDRETLLQEAIDVEPVDNRTDQVDVKPEAEREYTQTDAERDLLKAIRSAN